MSTPYEASGRIDQKRRTREALVHAARDLVASGVTPTVEQAAAAAAVSRPTAYRYFPNQRALLAAAHPETAARTLLPPDAPEGDPAARLEAVIRAFTDLIVGTEGQQRTMLRLSLEADPVERAGLPLRQGRAIAWFEEALSPLREELSEQSLRQLVLAIRSAVGIEALVWLTDMAGLSRADAAALMSWSAQALLNAALTMAPPPGAGDTPAG